MAIEDECTFTVTPEQQKRRDEIIAMCSVRKFEGAAIHDNPEVYKCPECGS